MKGFDEIVKSYERTGFATPEVYDGELHDGRTFYVRSRHGSARLTIDHDIDKSSWVDCDFLSGDKFEEVFMELARKHPEIDTHEVDDVRHLIEAAQATFKIIAHDQRRLFEPELHAIFTLLGQALEPFGKGFDEQ